MCAHAVRVALQEIPGVDSVRVSLNDGYADIALAESNTVTVEQVRSAIRKNGFSPREARVRVRGAVARRDSTLLLRLPGGASFRLLGSAPVLEPLKPMEAAQVTVEGDVPASEDATTVELLLQVRRIESEQQRRR